MISVSEAQHRIAATVSPSKTTSISTSSACGYVLAKDILSPVDLPSFDQSAMDGYAVRTQDFFKKNKISVTGESSAGKSFTKKIVRGQAIRIFTGAEIPAGADAVVMQEKTSVHANNLSIEDENVMPGLNIRRRGSQIKKGELAMSSGSVLTPAALSFLESMGINKIPVFKKPVVTIVVTGSELVKAGSALSRGKIFESNSVALEAALKQAGIEKITTVFVSDDPRKTRKAFRTAMEKADFILFSGGISVGDYDFTGQVLKEEKVKEIFYKVRQKPGKPLYFGSKKNTYIFGLPGNPASVLTCFYEYVLPAIRKFCGYTHCTLPSLQLPVSKSIQKKKGMTHFLKATTDFKTVTPLDGQESYVMRSYAQANCLVAVPEETELVHAGTLVELHLLD